MNVSQEQIDHLKTIYNWLEISSDQAKALEEIILMLESKEKQFVVIPYNLRKESMIDSKNIKYISDESEEGAMAIAKDVLSIPDYDRVNIHEIINTVVLDSE